MNKFIFAIIVLIIVGVGAAYFFTKSSTDTYTADEKDNDTEEVLPVEPDGGIGDGAEPLDAMLDEEKPVEVIGRSVEGNDITAYHFGTGDKEVLFVGGIHGGYSWNTALVAYELIDYLETNPSAVPEGVKVTVIPALNPDGLAQVGATGEFTASDIKGTDADKVAARFNANDVDLNRNFDCEWSETGTWQNRSVSGGDSPFSEPESKTIRTYVDDHDIAAAVVWYSSAGGVYASQCNNGTLPETTTLTNVYADASGYPAYEEFNFYEITGDMVNWFASERIPAISVLLTTKESTEWNKNKAGIDAVLKYIAE